MVNVYCFELNSIMRLPIFKSCYNNTYVFEDSENLVWKQSLNKLIKLMNLPTKLLKVLTKHNLRSSK